MTSALPDIRRIDVEPAAAELPRDKEILARFPGAHLVAERTPYCRVRYAF
ncbi:MAG: hypothetical protein ABW022_19350 [Actinoplanes sp.]